jgi:hypothetical protein
MNASNIIIELDQAIPHTMDQLLESTIYGSQGKLQYSHINPIVKLQSIANKQILSIKQGDKIIAVVVFVERNNHAHKTFYVRYVSFINKYKTKRVNAGAQNKFQIREQGLKSKLMALLHQKLLTESNSQSRPTVLYAYIEEDNLPSVHMSQVFGYEKVRKMQTFVFNRFFPKDHEGVRALAVAERSEMIHLLEQGYHGYNFLELTQLFDTGQYFVYTKDGQILAGLKANIADWKIVHLPGLDGFLIQKILSRLPVFSRIFKKDQLKFLAFEAIWLKEGHEKELFELMEAVCARQSVYMGMMWFDTECKIGHLIADSSKLGIINAINKSGQAHILCKFNSVSDEAKQKYFTNPAYISAFDVT